MILSALAKSPSLRKITHFSCSVNDSWFLEGKESNCELLCQAIRGMTSLQDLNLRYIQLSSESMAEQVVSAIVDNEHANKALTNINLIGAGG